MYDLANDARYFIYRQPLYRYTRNLITASTNLESYISKRKQQYFRSDIVNSYFSLKTAKSEFTVLITVQSVEQENFDEALRSL